MSLLSWWIKIIKRISRFIKKRNLKVLLYFVIIISIFRISNISWKNLYSDFFTSSKHNVTKNSNDHNLTFVGNKISKMNKINGEQTILNADKFKELSDDEFVIVVQVHNSPNYLDYMVKSLEQVAGISTVLIIFSIKTNNDDIQSIIQGISFAKAVQIFYPYSINMFPNIFPGSDNKFCPNFTMKCEENVTKRHANVTEDKHFWWWTANEVFDHLKTTQKFNGTVIFLEEDDYVITDALHVAYLAKTTLPFICSHCHFIILAANLPRINRYINANPEMAIVPFGINPTNMGLGFNRTVWNIIKESREQFCFYSNADWVKSLQNVGTQQPEGKFYMVMPAGPRVMKIMMCKNKSKNECDLKPFIKLINVFNNYISPGLFSKSFKVKLLKQEICSSLEEDCEWNDIRDRDLCMFISE